MTVKVVNAGRPPPCEAPIIAAPGRDEPGMRMSLLKVPFAATLARSTASDDTKIVTWPHVVQNAWPVTLTMVSGGP